ncbi:hypothetical protein HMPREF2757_10530 [Brevibacterium sp. HMSC063G07]|nr:hypothetical protein HMPREF2757_10530 [Brevibacterium sp. HMSC063G07]
MFGGDDPEAIEQHCDVLIVAGVPALSKGPGDNQVPLSHKDAVVLQVQAVRALLLLPEAVGYYSGDVDTVYGKEAYLTITDPEEPLLSAFIAAVDDPA